MDHHPQLQEFLLDQALDSNYISPHRWHHDPLTQGHPLPCRSRASVEIYPSPPVPVEKSKKMEIEETVILGNEIEEKEPKKGAKKKHGSISFVDFMASRVDDMFLIYSPEIKRDIRVHLKEKFIEWASLYARKFFGPSTSRAISSCLRVHNIEATDLQKFAEFVSFLLDHPVCAGNKVVVWHGYMSSSRAPFCELVWKKQGVFVQMLSSSL